MSLKLSVKVVPGASQDKIVGWLGESLKIRVRAQPEKGKANTAVLTLLAEGLSLPVKNLSVCRGHTSSKKVIEILGLSDAELRSRLAPLVRSTQGYP